MGVHPVRRMTTPLHVLGNLPLGSIHSPDGANTHVPLNWGVFSDYEKNCCPPLQLLHLFAVPFYKGTHA